MKLFSIFLFLFTYIINPSLAFALSKKIPQLKYPKRHIVFQAGQLGDKPWNSEASFAVMVNFASLTFTKPIYVDSNYKIKPGAFKSWQWDNTTKSFIIKIDNSLKFDDRRTLNIRDVEYALIKSFLSQKGFYFRGRLEQIKDIRNLIGQSKYTSGMCKGIKILDETTIQIFLEKENPHFIYSLENALPFLAPPEDFKSDHFNFKTIPRGTGPYKITWSDPKSSLIRLEKRIINKDDIENETFPLSVDFINEGDPTKVKPDLATGAGSSGLRGRKGYETRLGFIPESQTTIDFNYSTELGKNKQFRKAVSLALDRKKIIEGYMQNKASHELIPSKYLGRSGLRYKHSVQMAKDIVNRHLKNISSKKKPLKGIFHGEAGKLKPAPRELARQLSEVGIFIEFEGKKVVRQFEDNRDAVLKLNGVSVSYTDPLSCFSRLLQFPNQSNLVAPPNNQALIKLYKNASKVTDLQQKADLLQKLSKNFKDNYYSIPIAEGYPVFTYKPKIESIGLGDIFASVDFLKIKMKK